LILPKSYDDPSTLLAKLAAIVDTVNNKDSAAAATALYAKTEPDRDPEKAAVTEMTVGESEDWKAYLRGTIQLPEMNYVFLLTSRMADPISLASGLLTLATFAFRSSISLHLAVQSFQSNIRVISELDEELEALDNESNFLGYSLNYLDKSSKTTHRPHKTLGTDPIFYEECHVQSDVASYSCGSFTVKQHSLFFMFDVPAHRQVARKGSVLR
jgi:Fungal N-terminal domain of STAND proteins